MIPKSVLADDLVSIEVVRSKAMARNNGGQI
jgi:hypothetical protein